MGDFTRAPQSTVLTDANGYTLDTNNPLAVNPAESGAANLATGQVTVSSSTATQLLTVNATRRAALITNNDAAIAIYVGGASVSTTTGHKLAAGSSMSIPFIGAIYAIAASGSPTASASEVYD